MLERFLRSGKKNIEYNIIITDQFVDEFEEICNYISYTLKNIDASNRLIDKVIYKVLLLENSPKMFTKIENKKLKRQYRRMVVDNYVVLYTVDEKKRNVYIVHIYYSGRDYLYGGYYS